MGKKIIRLTEEELHNLIIEATNQELDEIDGNARMRTQNGILNNVSLSPQGKSNIGVVQRGIELDIRATDSLISPFKTKYLFHCQNLRGAAAIVVFDLKLLYELTPQKAILKGNIWFNDKPLYGSIMVDFNMYQIYYNYKGKSPRYKLTIDPSKKDLWDKLMNELQTSIKSRTV